MRWLHVNPEANLTRYDIVSPPATHTRPATCDEYGCQPWENGWRTEVDETSTLGQMQAEYIRHGAGRRFTEHRDEIGMTVFLFEAGQRCFSADSHRVPVDRPELYLVRPGPGRPPRRHANGENWMDELHTVTDRIQTIRERG